MRKFLPFIFIIISFRLLAQSNTYHPFPISKSLWSDVHIDQYGVIKSRKQYAIFGDTVIGSYTYHKLYTRTLSCLDTSIAISNSSLVGAIMEDSFKRVYYYPLYPFNISNCSVNKRYKVYDFSKQIQGDTILFDTASSPYCYGYPYLTIKKVDSILIKGSYRKQFQFFEQGEIWVEGIGSLRGLLSAFILPVACSCVDALVCNLQNDSMYYYSSTYNYCICGYPLGINHEREQEKFEISPNPSTGIFEINSSEKVQYSVYDVFGREIWQSIKSDQRKILDLTFYPKGIYFVRGKADDKIFSRKIILY